MRRHKPQCYGNLVSQTMQGHLTYRAVISGATLRRAAPQAAQGELNHVQKTSYSERRVPRIDLDSQTPFCETLAAFHLPRAADPRSKAGSSARAWSR